MLFLLSLPYCKKLFSKINYTLFQADHSSSSCLEYPAGKYKAEAGPGPCEVCPIGKYKLEAGPGPCQLCPPHSKARFRGSAECRCLRGYYRGRNDDQHSACTKPPTSPRNLIAVMVCHYKVLLMWRLPRDEGGRNDTVFRVVCPTCGPEVQFSPSSPTFAQTSVHITFLTPGTNYTFHVIAENGVSSETKEQPNFAEISVTTYQKRGCLVKISPALTTTTTTTTTTTMTTMTTTTTTTRKTTTTTTMTTSGAKSAGWHKVDLKSITRLGRQLARSLGKDEEKVVRHTRQRLGVLIARYNAAIMASRHPTFAPPQADGDDD